MAFDPPNLVLLFLTTLRIWPPPPPPPPTTTDDYYSCYNYSRLGPRATKSFRRCPLPKTTEPSLAPSILILLSCSFYLALNCPAGRRGSPPGGPMNSNKNSAPRGRRPRGRKVRQQREGWPRGCRGRKTPRHYYSYTATTTHAYLYTSRMSAYCRRPRAHRATTPGTCRHG